MASEPGSSKEGAEDGDGQAVNARRKDERSVEMKTVGVTRARADAVGGGEGGDAARGAIRLVDDAGGIGAEDEVSGDEHFGATAASAEGGARRVSRGEAAEGVAGGTEDEHEGESVGVPGEGVKKEVKETEEVKEAKEGKGQRTRAGKW